MLCKEAEGSKFNTTLVGSVWEFFSKAIDMNRSDIKKISISISCSALTVNY